jgi:hypothetical protein
MIVRSAHRFDVDQGCYVAFDVDATSLLNRQKVRAKLSALHGRVANLGQDDHRSCGEGVCRVGAAEMPPSISLATRITARQKSEPRGTKR